MDHPPLQHEPALLDPKAGVKQELLSQIRHIYLLHLTEFQRTADWLSGNP